MLLVAKSYLASGLENIGEPVNHRGFCAALGSRSLPNSINALFPAAAGFLDAAETDIERAVLRVYLEHTDQPFRGMTTAQNIATQLFETGGYAYEVGVRNRIDRAISGATRKLEDAGLIEEPDFHNGRNGFRIISQRGREVVAANDYEAAKVRSLVSREMFHPSLPDAAWNAFRVGDYDTAVFEAFKAVESAVRRKLLEEQYHT